MTTMTQKKELAVAALQNGTVIDHIPSDVVFEIVKLLELDKIDKSVTIGNNLSSGLMKKKGIIKIADTYFPEATLNRIALLAPNAVINTIKDYQIIDKSKVSLPEELVNVVKCNNPKCISNNEPMATRLKVISYEPLAMKCHYCGRSVPFSDIKLK